MGCVFSRTPEGKIAQRSFGGHSKPRACFSADRTGHAILHALHEQLIKNSKSVKIYNEWYMHSLVVDGDRCNGVIVSNIQTGEVEVIRSKAVVFCTGGYGRVFKITSNAFASTADGVMAAFEVGIPLEDPEFVQFHPTGIYGVGCLITEGVRGEGGFLVNGKGERFMERYAPNAKDLASRDVVSRAMTIEINERRGCGENADHVLLHLEHIDADTLHKRLPGISETAKIFAGVDLTKEPIPVLPTVHYNMGGIPTNYKAEVLTVNGSEKIVPGLMAIGEAACVSVHGANRLGSNSLIDLVVFGRAAAKRAAELVKPGTPHEKISDSETEKCLDRFEKLRKGNGTNRTADLRLAMQKTMQSKCAVFRTEKTLKEGVEEIRKPFEGMDSISVKDKSLIFNTDLVETLEFDN